jgi:hypothetical protein
MGFFSPRPKWRGLIRDRGGLGGDLVWQEKKMGVDKTPAFGPEN